MFDEALRTTFDQAAEAYRRYRPHYPKALFQKMEQAAGLKSGSKLLEVGSGTGQATRPLAERGYDITAVELGKELAQKTRESLQEYPNVHVVTGAFEDVVLPVASFDLVYSATALHWVKAEVRYTKAALLLKAGGYLAIIQTHHVSDGAGDAFAEAVKPLYEQYSVSDLPMSSDPAFQLPRADELTASALDANLFELESFTTYPLALTYSAHDYVGLVGTYSPTIALAPEKRQQFLADLEAFIQENYDGMTSRNYAMTLTIARKK
jgi:SAM-dependent methyltransferase